MSRIFLFIFICNGFTHLFETESADAAAAQNLNETIVKLIEDYSITAPINRYGECKDHWGRPIGFYGSKSCLLAEFSRTVRMPEVWDSSEEMYLNLGENSLVKILEPLLNNTNVLDKFKNVAKKCIDYSSDSSPLYVSCVNYQEDQFSYATINCCPTATCYELPKSSAVALEHGQRLGGTGLNCTDQWCCSVPSDGESTDFPMKRPKSYNLFWSKETELINFSQDSNEVQRCDVIPKLINEKYIPTIECLTGGSAFQELHGVEALMALYSEKRSEYDKSRCYMGLRTASLAPTCAFVLNVQTLEPARFTSPQNNSSAAVFETGPCLITYQSTTSYLYCECHDVSFCDEKYFTDNDYLQLSVLEHNNTVIVNGCNDTNERALPLFLLCKLTVHLEEAMQSEVVGLDVTEIRRSNSTFRTNETSSELSEIYCYCIPKSYPRTGNGPSVRSCTETECNEELLRKHLIQLRSIRERAVDIDLITRTVSKCFRHKSDVTLPVQLNAATFAYDILCYFWYRTGHDPKFGFILKESIGNSKALPIVTAACSSSELNSGSGCACAEFAATVNEKHGACCCYPDANRHQLEAYADIFAEIEGSLT